MSRRTIGKLCVFGSYDDSELYSRNTALINALSACSKQVVNVRPKRARGNTSNHQRVASFGALLKGIAGSVADMVSLTRQRGHLRDADCYFVPYPAYIDLLLLRVLLPRRHRAKIIVDAFLCLQDTLVNDRRMLVKGGILSRLVGWLERITLANADLVFIDTREQRDQLSQQYQLQSETIAAIPVGIDEDKWTPLPALPLAGNFRVFFWGTFIPLHGVDTIIRAAHSLQSTYPQVQFSLVGDGQTADDCERLICELGLKNLEWHRGLVPVKALREQLAKAHCVLGIFGESAKAANVVPYKVYQAFAADKMVVSREGPAIRAIIGAESVSGVTLVPPADPKALAAAIGSVFKNYSDHFSAASTRPIFDQHLSNKVLLERVSAEVAKL